MGEFFAAKHYDTGTGVFPTEPPACSKCSDPNYNPLVDWQTLLTEQLNQLNRQPAREFTPSLTVLDTMIQSIQIGQ